MGVQALTCIAALVVHGRADARDQLRALTVDDVRPQQAAARVRVQQQVGHIGREPGKDFLAECAVVGKIGLEANGLDFSQLVHDRRDVRAVEPVELGCDCLQIGQARAAAPQHIRQHGRAGGRFAPQLRQQVHAQPRGLEFLRAQGGQPHAGQDLRADALHNCAPFPDGFSVFLRSGGGRSTQILFEQRFGRFWGLRAFYYPKFCPECGRRLTENCDDK